MIDSQKYNHTGKISEFDLQNKTLHYRFYTQEEVGGYVRHVSSPAYLSDGTYLSVDDAIYQKNLITGLYWNWTGVYCFINDEGSLHRMDGPAVMADSGNTNVDRSVGIVREYCVNGINYTVAIDKWAKEVDIDLNNMNDHDRVLLEIRLQNYL